MWNPKNKINKHNGNRLIDTENTLVSDSGEGVGGLGEKGEGIGKCRSVVTEQSRGCEVQHMECRQ